jgi:hypothetical protein
MSAKEKARLTWAAKKWREAARWADRYGSGIGAATCRNAARELEILRDTGKEVRINTRTS